MTKVRPSPHRTVDRDGLPIIKVALNSEGSQWATVDADDYDRLPASTNRIWIQNDNGSGYAYVKTTSPTSSGRLVMPARINAGAGRGKQVTYADGDRTNLRSRNLILKSGSRAKQDHRKKIQVVAAVA